MFSTYRPEDVTVLLKDISGLVKPLPARERERLIQSGVHYSEMLPLEYEPSPAYLEAYRRALRLYARPTAAAVASLAGQIRQDKGGQAVLVSLARAGTPVGILLKRCMERRWPEPVPHYTVSIIRGKGIDRNAMRYILDRHAPQAVQFVDGWTGKGAIQNQLNEAMRDYPGVDPSLAVLSDPACVAGKAGTRTDFLIPSSLLNCTVSGLLSRTFCRGDLIGPADFHGAAFYAGLRDRDQTYPFIERIEAELAHAEGFVWDSGPTEGPSGLEELRRIARDFGVRDLNFVKPGLGEATRVLLRRLPRKLLVHSLDDRQYLGHLYQLAAEKQVPVEEYPLLRYKACGIIQDLADT